MPTPSLSTSDALARRAAALCADLKAHDVVVLDLRGVTDLADFFVIASGTSDTHVRAVADHVANGLRTVSVTAHHVEGVTQGRWALLDFVDIVVHVFHPALRSYYQLERLWGDAPALSLTPQGALA